ncbi:MAG: hypothetical protein QXU32_08415 [Nitrososphaerales archaeon]
MSSMKSPVMSYAALGVGLAIMLTVGLTAISSVVEQPLVQVQQEQANEAMKAIPPEIAQRAADVGSEAESLVAPAPPTTGQEALTQEQGYMTTEPPTGPLAGLSVAIPYIVAAIVSLVVFVFSRKRVSS